MCPFFGFVTSINYETASEIHRLLCGAHRYVIIPDKNDKISPFGQTPIYSLCFRGIMA